MWKIFFLKNHTENKADGLALDHFFFLKKTLCKVKASDPHLSLIYFGRPRLGKTIKTV